MKQDFFQLINSEEIIFNNQLWKEYNKLIYDCDFNREHLKPDKRRNLCNHCYRLLILPESKAEKTRTEMKKITLEEIPYVFPIWRDFLNEEKNNQKSIETYNGFERYRKSLFDKNLL